MAVERGVPKIDLDPPKDSAQRVLDVGPYAAMGWNMRVRITSMAIAVLALTVSTLAQAETLELVAVADGFVGDGLEGADVDGRPDGVAENFGTRVAFLLAQGDQRAVMHFDVNSVKGLRVRKATLKLKIIHKETSQSTFLPIEVRGYNSIGALRLGDFYRGTFIKVFDGVAAPFDVPVLINVTDRVRSGLKSPSGMIGFTLRTNANGIVTFGSLEDGLVVAPRLVIQTE